MMNNTIDGLTIFSKESSFVQDNKRNPDNRYNKHQNRNAGDIHFCKYYVNNLQEKITTVERNGVRQINVNRNKTNEGYFLIVNEIKFNAEAIGYFRQVFNACDMDNCPDLAVIKESFDRQIAAASSAQGFQEYVLITEVRITLDDFKTNGDSLYMQDYDTVVSTKGLLECPNHPFADNAVSLEQFSGLKANDGIKISIDLVDNNSQYGDRYFYIAQKEMKIEAVRNSSKRNGVYFTTCSRDGTSITMDEYTLEEAEDKLGLYKNKEEAKAAGDLKTSRKQELSDLQHKYEKEILEYNNEKTRLARIAEDVRAKNAESENIQKERIRILEATNIEAQAKLDERKANIDEEVYVRTQKARAETEEAKAKQEASKSWLAIVTIIGTVLASSMATYISVLRKTA